MTIVRRIVRALTMSVLAGAGLELLLLGLRVPTYVLPRPSETLRELWVSREALAGHALVTFSEALLGLAVALVASALVALPASLVAGARDAVKSGLIIVQSTPVVALGPVLVAWLGPGILSKSLLAGLVCFPAIAITILSGLTSCSRDELQLYRAMGATRLELIFLLRVPRAIPALFTALALGVPLAVLGAIVGEFVGAREGLGFYIMTASYYLRTGEMLSAIIIAAAGSISLVGMVNVLRSRASWERYEREDEF